MAKTKAKEKTKIAPVKKRTSATKKRKAPTKKANGLHLPSLAIKGFRGIKELELPSLGRVTLLAGKNGIGKSTVLEAVQLYASVGDPGIMRNILDKRENILAGEDEEGDFMDVPDYGSLFFGYDEPQKGDVISIGSTQKENMLEIELSSFEDKEAEDMLIPFSILEEEFRCLAVSFGNQSIGKIPFISSKGSETSRYAFRNRRGRSKGIWNAENAQRASIDHEILGPGLPSNEKIIPWYEDLLLTPEEGRVLEVLQFINPNIEGLASRSVSRHSYRRIYPYRRIVAKIEGADSQIPLRSLGDGIVRLLGLAVALINAKGGFLLMDEIENGIHHSLYTELWKFIMQTAEKNNVQVIAATHGWSCIAGFARVALDLKSEGIESRLVTIKKDEEKTRAVTYTEEQLVTAAESGIEVRG